MYGDGGGPPVPKRGLLLAYVVDGGGEGVAVPAVRTASPTPAEVVWNESSRVRVTESAPSLMLPELPLTYLVVALVSETRLAHEHVHTPAPARARALTPRNRGAPHTLDTRTHVATACRPPGRSTRDARHDVHTYVNVPRRCYMIAARITAPAIFVAIGHR